MTKLGAAVSTPRNRHLGELEEALATLASDPEFVAEELALAIAEDVAEAMEVEGVSKAELARRMGVSRAYISRVLDAPPNLTLLSISKVALALGLTPEVRLRRPRRRSVLLRSFTDSATPRTIEARNAQPSPKTTQLLCAA